VERALAGAAVRIQVEEADELLVKLGANSTDLRLRLTADPGRDSEQVFLASFLLRRILGHSLAAAAPAATLAAAAFTVPPPPLRRPGGAIAVPPPPIMPSAATMVTSTTKIPTDSRPAVCPLARGPLAAARPRAFLDIQLENQPQFRVVVELRPDLAPRMVENFLRLCTGLGGRSYVGSKIYRSLPDEKVEGGDIEHNDGTGGHSAFLERHIVADQVPLQGRQVQGRLQVPHLAR